MELKYRAQYYHPAGRPLDTPEARYILAGGAGREIKDMFLEVIRDDSQFYHKNLKEEDEQSFESYINFGIDAQLKDVEPCEGLEQLATVISQFNAGRYTDLFFHEEKIKEEYYMSRGIHFTEGFLRETPFLLKLIIFFGAEPISSAYRAAKRARRKLKKHR